MLTRIIPIAIAIFLFIPILVVLSSWLNGIDYQAWLHLYSTTLIDYVTNTTILSTGVVVGALTLGTLCAWLISTFEFYGRKFFSIVLVLPLAMPGYIMAYTYTGLLDFSGPIQTTIRKVFAWEYGTYYFPEIRSIEGAIVMLSLVLYPYVYLLGRDAFSRQSRTLSLSAQTMGLNSIQRFLHVSLPIARPALAAGTALALMETLADYGTVAFFGINVFTTGIFRVWFGMGNVQLAMQLASILLIVVIAVVAYEIQCRKKISLQSSNSTPNELKTLSGIRAIIAISFCTTVFCCGFFVPFLQLLYWTLVIANQKLTFNYTSLLFNSIFLSTITTMVGVTLAILCALSIRTWRHSNAIKVAYFCSKLGYAVPGTIIAIGVMLPFGKIDHIVNTLINSLTGHSPGLIFSGTMFTLVFAYLVRFVPIAILGIEPQMKSMPRSVDQISHTLGVSNWKHLRFVQMPILYPSILTSAMLVFLECLKELPATLILRPFNFNTLAVKGFELATDERLADAAPAIISIVLVALVPVAVLSNSINVSYKLEKLPK